MRLRLTLQKRHACNLPPDSNSYPQHVKVLPNNLGCPSVAKFYNRVAARIMSTPINITLIPTAKVNNLTSTSTTI